MTDKKSYVEAMSQLIASIIVTTLIMFVVVMISIPFAYFMITTLQWWVGFWFND